MIEPFIFDHVGIAVNDLEAAKKTYETLLDCAIGPSERLEDRGISVAFVGNQAPRLELLGADQPHSELASFLKKRGEGVHHICVRVDNLEKTVARLKQMGARLTKGGIKTGANSTSVAFVHPKGAHGVLLELMQEHT